MHHQVHYKTNREQQKRTRAKVCYEHIYITKQARDTEEILNLFTMEQEIIKHSMIIHEKLKVITIAQGHKKRSKEYVRNWSEQSKHRIHPKVNSTEIEAKSRYYT